MLGRTAMHALPPHFEAAALHLAAHECNDGFFVQSELQFNGLKGRAVFPSHLDDAVDVVG